MTLNKVLDIVDFVENVLGTGIDIFEIFGQDYETLLSTLQVLEQTVRQGFEKLESAIDQNTLLSQWQDWTKRLDDIQLRYIPILFTLKSVIREGNRFYVISGDRRILLVEWCEGGDSADEGAFNVLSRAVEDLGALFLAGGTEADPTMLTVWSDICESTVQRDLTKFVGQTAYTMTFDFMQEIFGILGSIFYAHDGLLRLYMHDKGGNPKGYVSLRTIVRTTFGRVDQSNTVWSAFAAVLDSFLKVRRGTDKYSEAVAEYGYCMTTCDNGTDVSNLQSQSFTGEDRENPFFVNEAQYDYQTNQFYAGLRLIVEDYSDKKILSLQVRPVEIGNDMTFNPLPWLGGVADARHPFLMGATTDIPYFNSAYSYIVPEPHDIQQDQYLVIVGIQFAPCDEDILPIDRRAPNRMGLRLRYGLLDVSDKHAPRILPLLPWSVPVIKPHDFFAVGGAHGWDNTFITSTDLRPAGTADYFPATNAFIVRTRPTFPNTANSNEVGTLVGVGLQNAPLFHRISWFQPANVF